MFEYQMPSTISDIARASGLSTATVDRALHGRGGVSAANRQRVLSTARELGYLPMEGAVALPSRAVRLAFLIPRLDSAFMAEIARTLEARAAAHPLVAQCEIIPLDAIGPAAFQDGLAHLPDGVDGIGAITTDHPKTRAALSHLTESGLPLITLASDIAGPRAGYVGIDNRAAGRTAAQLTALFAGAQPGTVALCLGSRAFMGHAEREKGFMEALPSYAPNLTCLDAIETSEDPERMRRAVASLMRREPALRAIYVIGGGKRGAVEALDDAPERPSLVLHDLTETSRTWLEQGQIDAIIDQNAPLLAEEALRHLLGAIAGGAQTVVKVLEPRILIRENLPQR